MEKKIDGNSLIRPLDIFKNSKSSDFQKLLQYDNKTFFFNNYYISDKCSDYEFKFKEFRKKEEEIKNQNEKDKEKEDKLNKEKNEKEKQNEKQNENEEINTTSSSKTESHISVNEKNHPIIKKKKKKAKMVDLNIKTGFYTMTNQEKNFSEVYICGENELLNNVPKK